jgi:hypothetical protein
MNHTVRIFLASCFSALSLHARAQQDTMMLGIGTGWNANTILDEFHSPMPYRGDGYMFQVCLKEQNDRFYDHLALAFQLGRISPDIDNQSASQLYRGSIDWIRTYRLKGAAEKWMIYLGFHFFASYNATSHVNWPNNSYSYCLALNLGPTLVIDYSPWQRDLQFQWELSLPVLNYVIRPSLGSIVPEGAIRRSREDIWGFMSGGSITSLHEYQRIYSNLFVSYRVTPRIDARAGYQWDFSNYAVNNHYQSTNHLIYVTMYYRFKK